MPCASAQCSRASASPAATDIIADLEFAGRDDAAAARVLGILRTILRDPAAATVEAEMQLLVALAGGGVIVVAPAG